MLTVALVPTIGFGGDGDSVTTRTTSSSMESVFIEVHNSDNVRRTFRVFAIGAQTDTPAADVRLLPGESHDVAGGESQRVLAVFQNLRPGETREARVCYAPVNLPADKTCEAIAIERL
ncbi:hypothetical protein [Croceicoccus bisphenolivorans]|uniref:hypothetical protein n=1 Tax=Croceicoccus bisphenolivorans TaxID=1783232 RepID=UPI0012E8BE97|nr:hypothetical protein [Croceicoccus bisphenolivorans]